MRRLLALITVCIVLAGVLFVPASAESMASQIDLYCTVNAEGDCLVRMTALLELDGTQRNLQFPLPSSATNITLNGSSITTSKTAGAINVDLGRLTNDAVGQYQFVFDYTLPEAVKVSTEEVKLGEQRKILLTIPMLCGFQYPIQKLNFVITMPTENIPNPPDFTSIYRQDSIMSDLTVNVNRSQIIGASKVVLNDRESMTMTMVVPREMFPTVSTYVREGDPELIPMLICAGVAMLYWLLFLRTLPLLRSRTSAAPEGITAGELGCRLTLSGADLTMMVFSWAQLGYVLIQMDGHGRVLLHKRMEMGNERSAFENQVFRALFGSRRVVDGTGMAYARLVRKVAGMVPNERNMHKGNSGNMKIFRILACGSGIFCGICVAMNMTAVPALQILLSIVLGIFGAVSAWLMQNIAYRTHLRGKTPVYIGLVMVLLWIGLGLLCGQLWIPLGFALGEWLFGYFAAYGGRRSDLGRADAGQILGLRSYLKRLPRDQIGRLLDNDPDHFFNMAPCALAMGILHPYAKTFARRKLDQCPYLYTRVSGKRTAGEWAQLMADAADMMDARARRMQLEKWAAIQIQISRK